MHMGLKVNARLASEGTHWETMEERTANVCQKAQGRARQNAPQRNAQGPHEEPRLIIARFAQ